MCGILGGFSFTQSFSPERVRRALALIAHRGPDDCGFELSDVRGGGKLVLGHTRLSIIDCTQGGHQPMHTQDGRYSLVFNGEIYNYKEIRAELAGLGYQFSTNSDTEVLLLAWREWGAEALDRFIGMYAFAILDRQINTLTCVRDPFGIKPFFYKNDDRGFFFGSEIPVVLDLADEQPRLNWERAYAYLIYGHYDNHETTMFDGVRSLPPAHLICIDLNNRTVGEVVRYSRPRVTEDRTLTFKDAAEKLRCLILEDVRLHMRSDVPIGAALSGGLDSSIIACVMRHVEPDIPLHTFTYVEDSQHLSEERWADIVNNRVAAIPHKVRVTPHDIQSDLKTLVRAQGEPFGGASIYAQMCVFGEAQRQGIKVLLEGQGADELYGGYHGYPGPYLMGLLSSGNYLKALRFLNAWSAWPGRSRADALKGLLRQLMPPGVATRVMALGGLSPAPQWLNARHMQQHGVKLAYQQPQLHPVQDRRYLATQLANSLTVYGLPHLLRHGDRNAMHFSIENRVPFLTSRAADFALSLPDVYVVSETGRTKCLLREAMRGIVPDEILDRRDKIGFETPQKTWLDGIFDEEIRRNWSGNLGKVLNIEKIVNSRNINEKQKWRILNFTIWVNEFGVDI